MKINFILFLLLFYTESNAQKQNNFWCWGDSAAIDFNGLATPSTSIIRSRGSCASISDTSGQLLFYVAYDTTVLLGQSRGTKIYNKNHQIMFGGDSLKTGGWYHENIIIPDPGASDMYYIFYIGVTLDSGLYYAMVDMNQNGGMGTVIMKNMQLQTFKQVDCLNAVKHGNGRDWWIIYRKFEQGVWNNDFYSYLITPSGIGNVIIQSIGSVFHTNNAKISFNTAGNKMLFSDYGDLIELYDFDRCTGIISNPFTINPEATGSNYYKTWGSEFSPLGAILYISTSDTVSYLYQYNLNDTNPQATRITLWSTNYPQYTGGDLKLAPDGKIYFTCAYDNGINFNYPYADTMYNYINMNLSVINYPDSLGTACDYAPFSFYLGGKRTYYGLPNNPDYGLGALMGSACDSLTAISELPIKQHLASIYPNPVFNYTTVTGTEKINSISICDISGQALIEIDLARQQFYKYSLNFEKHPPGIYFVTIKSDSCIETKIVVKL